MKKLSNTEDESKKHEAYQKKTCNSDRLVNWKGLGFWTQSTKSHKFFS